MVSEQDTVKYLKLKNLYKDQENEGGFTLVEILVVILIIGILAAIAIPIFLNQRQEANKAAINSDVKSVALAVQQFYTKGGKNSDLLAAAGVGKNSLSFNGPGAEGQNLGSVRWNSVYPTNKVEVSNGTYVAVNIFVTGNSSWKAMPEGEFCLTAGNANTTDYNYPGGQPLLYKNLTYYDSQQGGLVPMDKLVAAYKANQPVSCSGFVKLYIDAAGL